MPRFEVIADSSLTSGGQPQSSSKVSTRQGLFNVRHLVQHKLPPSAERIWSLKVSETVGPVSHFRTNVALSGGDAETTLVASHDALGYVYYHFASGQLEYRAMPVLEEAQWPSTACSADATLVAFGEYLDQSSAIDELRSAVHAVETIQPLHRSPSLRDLARRAAMKRATRPPDLQEWARRLAEDVADLND